MKKLFAAGLLVAFAIAAWLQIRSDRARLEVVLEDAARTRDRDIAISEHLDEYKQEVQRVRGDLAKVGEGFDPKADPAKLLPKLEAAAHGARVSWSRDTGEIGLEGKGGAVGALAALNGIAHDVGFGFVVERVVVARDDWSGALVMEPPPPDPRYVEPVIPSDATPWCLVGCSALHARIDATRRQTAELERLIGDVKGVTEARTTLQVELDVLHDDHRRLHHVLDPLNDLLGGTPPVFVTGRVSPDRDRVLVDGELAKGIDAVALAGRAKGYEIVNVSGGRAVLEEGKK